MAGRMQSLFSCCYCTEILESAAVKTNAPLAAFIQGENRLARTDRFFVMADDDAGTQLAQRTRSFVQLFEKMEGTTLPQYRLGLGHAVE